MTPGARDQPGHDQIERDRGSEDDWTLSAPVAAKTVTESLLVSAPVPVGA
jgi:hypothetical protein